jgi:hypothetical protein
VSLSLELCHFGNTFDPVENEIPHGFQLLQTQHSLSIRSAASGARAQ